MSLLVTAFGRFDGGSNCSESLLRRLESDADDLERLWTGRVAFRLLDVDTEAAEGALAAAIDGVRPTHVLLMGQAAERSAVSLERVARNCRNLRTPDERGRIGELGPVRPGGPDTIAATWPDLDGAARAISAAGVPARLSDDAGAHLCNQTLYLALEAGRTAAPPFVATFLHLPLIPEQLAAGEPAAARLDSCFVLPLDDMARAVRAFLGHTRCVEPRRSDPPPQ